MSRAVNPMRRVRAVTVAVVGSGAVVVYAFLAAVQILVLNPLAAVLGAGLDRIFAGVAAAGQSMSTGLVIFFLAVGPLIAIAVLVAAWRRPGRQARLVAVCYLMLLGVGASAYFWASFGPGIALADTYFISGGDHSAWAVGLYATSGLAVANPGWSGGVEPLPPSLAPPQR